MATVVVYWGDGTSDKLTISYSGTPGSSRMTVTSDPNFTSTKRVKSVKLKGTNGAQLGTLTVTQQVKVREFNADFNKDFK